MDGLLRADSRLLQLARASGRRTPVPLVVVLAFACLFVSRWPIGVLSDSIPWLDDPTYGYPSGWTSAFHMTVYLLVRFAPLALLVFAWIYAYEGRAPRTLGFERRRAGRRYARGLLVGAALFSLAAALIVAFSTVWQLPGDPARQGGAVIGPVLFVLLGWMAQGGAEEVLVRGWVLQAVGVRYGAWAAVLVSSAVFAGLHVLNAGFDWLPFLNLVLIGLFFALFALWEGALWGVCALHAGWNWAQGNLLGFSVSGAGVGAGGVVVHLGANGTPLVTGGPFGPEGGLMVTAVMCLAIVAIVVLQIVSRCRARRASVSQRGGEAAS